MEEYYMDEFLYDLAYMKYKLWNELFNYQKVQILRKNVLKELKSWQDMISC